MFIKEWAHVSVLMAMLLKGINDFVVCIFYILQQILIKLLFGTHAMHALQCVSLIYLAHFKDNSTSGLNKLLRNIF